MSFRHLLILFSVSICVSSKTFTLVLDTTVSMRYEISEIRTRIGDTINSIRNTSAIENYIIVPFNDPDVGPAQIYTEVEPFLNSINSLRVSGGDDIPENSLTGLVKALQESKPESDIFLFTDACAKDEARFNDIQRLCRITRSKVIVFLSGSCPYSENNKFGNIETYYQVTKVCFGNVFQLDQTNYAQAFKFMKEIIRDDYNDVQVFERFTGYRSLSFSADMLTRDVIVAVTGDFPSLQLFEDSGHSPRTDMLIETPNSQVVRIVKPHRGEYRAVVRCQGVTSVTIYTRNEFPLQIGFSPFSPASIMETTSKPLPGRDSFIYVLVPKSYEYQLNTLTIHVLNDDSYKTVNLMENGVNAQIYITQAYFKSGSKFRMTINGIDKASSKSVSMTSKTLEPQIEVTSVPWSAAVIEAIIPEYSLTDYKKTARLACKATGCPQPTISWENGEGQKIESVDNLLQYPATYISYVEIPNMTENRTITCKASTASGEDSRKVELFVYRPYVFQIMRTPEDTTIPYEEEGKLYCEVEAYPDPQITWYHNDIKIVFPTNEVDDDNNDDMEYSREENALVITNMTSLYAGTYKCEVSNEANFKSYSAEVRISGLEPPELEMSVTELTAKLGESVQIGCRVLKGKPNPTVTWKYKPVIGYDFTDLADDIEVNEGNITINEVMSKHKGTYKCEGVNEQGQSSLEVNLKVIYAPRIVNAETTTKEVHRDELVLLECNVDAEPEASVRWERADGVSFPDDRHVIDGHSLKFVAHYNDTGSYRCIAENEAGMAEKAIDLNVLVPPYITPVPQNLIVREGDLVKLPCNVQEANPPPTITWRFISVDSVSKLIFRGESLFTKELVLPIIKKAQAGTYLCIVQSRAGLDRIETVVNVV